MSNDSTLPEMHKKSIILGVVLENFPKIGLANPSPELES